MRNRRLLAGAGALTIGLAFVPALVSSANASPRPDAAHGLRDDAVFVQLNGAAANSIEAFSRAGDGSLTPVGTFFTGGKGAKQVKAPVDALASQGSLATSDDGKVLIAVNAGSNTVSTLKVRDFGLQLTSTVPSRGDFPSSVTVRGSLVYVLNAGGHGTVSGYRLNDSRLTPIPGAVADLGLTNTAVPAFITSPAQVGISPDGRTLAVTTKANNTIETFPVRNDGRLGTGIVTASQGPVPFSFVFDAHGNLQVQQAGDGTNASYAVKHDSSLVALGESSPSGGTALCWSVRVGRYLFGANAASGTLTSWRLAHDGTSTIADAVAANVSGGVIDLAASRGGRFLYALSAAAGTINVLGNNRDGSLTSLSTVTGLPTITADDGPEGIVAT